jgi:drug/metabolite transporter (DMT)-like permease
MVPLCIRRWRWSVPTLKAGTLLGLLLFGSFALLISGLQRTSATNTGLLAGLCVVWVPLFRWGLFGKGLQLGTLIGVALCLAGVFVMSGRWVASLNLGDVLVVCGSLFAALHILTVDHCAQGHDAAALTLTQVTLVAALSCAVSFGSGTVMPTDLNGNLMFALLTTAVVSTAFAFWVQTKYQRETTPTRAAMIFNLEPVFSALLAYSVLDEPLGIHIAVACGLIVAGMCATELRLSRKPFGPA